MCAPATVALCKKRDRLIFHWQSDYSQRGQTNRGQSISDHAGTERGHTCVCLFASKPRHLNTPSPPSPLSYQHEAQNYEKRVTSARSCIPAASSNVLYLLLFHGRCVTSLLLLLRLESPFSVLLVSKRTKLFPGKRHPNRDLRICNRRESTRINDWGKNHFRRRKVELSFRRYARNIKICFRILLCLQSLSTTNTDYSTPSASG